MVLLQRWVSNIARSGVRISKTNFLEGIRQWLQTGTIPHDTRHVRDLDLTRLPTAEAQLGVALAKQLKHDKAILGIFDEGCMGMYNAMIDDELLNPCGIYKERFSQSALVAEMRLVSDEEANQARTWLDKKGMTFVGVTILKN